VADNPPELTVADTKAWRRWLGVHHSDSAGVWLALAKKGKNGTKGTTTPTSLIYDEALDEALSHGWIDGQRRGRDAATFIQRFTPRRARSVWSKRNVGIAERLIAEGRMRPSGLAEVQRAKKDGRWDAAYPGSAAITVPDDLAAALGADAKAAAMFGSLNSQNRYAVLYRIHGAKRAETRARRIEQFVAMLAHGQTIYPN
jgi:uncharacterized protein YdeI (YjbR/CyaY-like superfamily)